MTEFSNCEHTCENTHQHDKLLCCMCGNRKRDEFCEHCDRKFSRFEEDQIIESEIGASVLNSGIHYWYKLKYEFNILKYIKHYQTDFNKQDKGSFSEMKHDDEFILFVRASGTHMLHLTERISRIKKYRISHVLILVNTFKEYLKYDYLFYHGAKGKINNMSKTALIKFFRDWIQKYDIWSVKVSDELYGLEWK